MTTLLYIVAALAYCVIGYGYVTALYYHRYHCDKYFTALFFPYPSLKKARAQQILKNKHCSYQNYMAGIGYYSFWFSIATWPTIPIFTYFIFLPYYWSVYIFESTYHK